MMTTTNSGLVRAPVLPPMPIVRVRALGRPDGSPSFCVGGVAVPRGAEIDVPLDQAQLLEATGKVERVR
jgi:hypothetical protein